ncbi:PP2C family protein-serine/threonine phosphatase [Streptomyces sp. 549]|uniref:PP2C family protein-serine/threonine phosphatase n=1 Tax=Streptomyces sp. 549 TaxID=3049076 RepID=UPI0024C3BB62|nr:PP2C family protein-serine/threonine phosphatase [Streptomyces sp. 549]MDK1473004.1 PP2C family protein-serine/threonine phosphatase [Streptomyces sp. 549]
MYRRRWWEGESASGRLARLLPAVLVVLGVIIQLLTPPDITFAAIFAAAPLVAAPLYSARATALTGVAATVALVVLIVAYDSAGWAEDVMQTATVGTVAVLAVGINRVVRRGNQRLAWARSVAEVAQMAVLPVPPAQVSMLDVAARYQAAQADARIGGDLYAVQETPYGIRLIIGDVRGKGLDAVETVAVVIGAFREAAEQEAGLHQLAGRLDRALTREVGRGPRFDRIEGFTTAVLVEVDDRGMLRLVNCGHPSPLLLLPDGTVRLLDPAEHALPLGLLQLGGTDAARPKPCEVPFPVGATLLMHTDGLTEARDARGEFYDPAPRIRRAGWQRHGPQALLDGLLADVGEHSGGRSTDDMALLAVVRRE